MAPHDVMENQKTATVDATRTDIRTDWSRAEVNDLFEMPYLDLLFQAQTVHRQEFAANEVQLSTLLNIKQGGCPEDCGYCSQSVHFDGGVEASALLDSETVAEAARAARDAGAARFCMGAAWRDLKDRDVPKIAAIIAEVKALGLETCMTLGMLTEPQSKALKKAGLDYYNHNLDTSPEYYKDIVTTRTYEDRLNTLSHVRDAGIHVCSGGIIGMGETREDRAGLLHTLATLPEHPGSVPINMLVPIEGTPLGQSGPLDGIELARTIAVARLLMPKAYVRLSAGRRELGDDGQALCFMAGANSIFYGDELLTTSNPDVEDDRRLFARLGLVPEHQQPIPDVTTN